MGAGVPTADDEGSTERDEEGRAPVGDSEDEVVVWAEAVGNTVVGGVSAAEAVGELEGKAMRLDEALDVSETLGVREELGVKEASDLPSALGTASGTKLPLGVYEALDVVLALGVPAAAKLLLGVSEKLEMAPALRVPPATKLPLGVLLGVTIAERVRVVEGEVIRVRDRVCPRDALLVAAMIAAPSRRNAVQPTSMPPPPSAHVRLVSRGLKLPGML